MSDARPGRVEFVVTAGESGKRLDRVVLARLGDHGRRGIAELFRRGAVSVGGNAAKKGWIAREGDTVAVVTGGSEHIVPEPLAPLDVVLETREVVVARKPAGQPTAPLRLGETGSLAGALLGRYPELAGIGHRLREPGLLHRLDTHTSGLVVAARTREAFDVLSRALSEGRWQKRYLAIVEERGLPDAGVVDVPLRTAPEDPRRVVRAEPDEGRPAETRYRVLLRVGAWALVECDVAHAHRHQVRAHLAFLGHPIAGDRIYGGPEAPSLGERHALHASYVAWAGDEVVPPFVVTDALPPDLASFFDT